GSDGKLRTWKAVPTPAGHIELTPDLIVDTDGQPVMSVHFEPTRDEAGNMTGGGVMFCGLEDGRVRVFDKTTGAQFDLLGHAKAVHSLGVLQGILVTSSWDGTVRLWTPKEGTYQNTHTIEIGYPVKCMTIAEQTMWIGGVCGITGISIMDLTIQGRIDTQSPVMKMLIYENHVVAITLDGKLFVFDPNGNETASMDCALNYVHNGDKLRKPCCNSCLDGVVINGKAALLVGQMNGSVRAYTLPTLKPLVWWQTAMQRKNADVRIVKSLGEEMEACPYGSGRISDESSLLWLPPQTLNADVRLGGSFIVGDSFRILWGRLRLPNLDGPSEARGLAGSELLAGSPSPSSPGRAVRPAIEPGCYEGRVDPPRPIGNLHGIAMNVSYGASEGPKPVTSMQFLVEETQPTFEVVDVGRIEWAATACLSCRRLELGP
ncbi:hypothetical protein FOZ63_031221, partial [Perkinsus olseni]